MKLNTPKFSLGRVVSTPTALQHLKEHQVNPKVLLIKHWSGDFGDLCDEDKQLNDEAIYDGDGRILSSYKVGGESISIITEADRSSTTILCGK